MTTPYRDDFDALSARHAALAEELSAVRARTREIKDLQQQEERLAGEVDTLRKKLDGISSRRSLPLLSSVRIASPCTASWDEMTGDERVRFCGHCEKNVYNLSGMAREEAESLLRDRGAEICVRFYKRHDGTMLTADCPVGVKRKRRRRIAAAAVSSGLAAAGALLYQATRPTEVTMMGAVAYSDEMEMGKLEVTPQPASSPASPAPSPPPTTALDGAAHRSVEAAPSTRLRPPASGR